MTAPSRSRAWLVLVLALVLFGALRLTAAQRDQSAPSTVHTSRVVVVGVPGLYRLRDVDRTLLDAHADTAQAGAVSVRPRLIGDCAAAGWTTLGAGRRAGVGKLCTPQVANGRVLDWDRRLSAAAADHGDARLGTLAASVPGCVAAVGAGAALAAARPDGSLADYQTGTQFAAGGSRSRCPLTLVDAAGSPEAVVSALASQPDVTLIVTGIGPPAGSSDPQLQVVYVLGGAPSGWLTSDSTRRTGVVNLTDLTRTLIGFGQGAHPTAAAVDGAPFEVEPAALNATQTAARLRSVAALSEAAPVGYLTVAVAGALGLAALGVALARRRWACASAVLTLMTTTGAGMVLTGAWPWSSSPSPAVLVGVAVVVSTLVLAAVASGAATRTRAPVAVVAAALTTGLFTVDAALGGVLQPGSLLNSRPVNGGRWYGYGNVTFALYAESVLVVAASLAHLLLAAGRRRSAVVAVAVLGLTFILCDGWPSMGADFGGVLALSPPLAWLALRTSGVRISWRLWVTLAAAGVTAVLGISWLDWRRGPDRRSHLGNFVQRLLDGDAGDIVLRKAEASVASIVNPWGLLAVALGVVAWVVLFRRFLPGRADDWPLLRPVLVAALAAAILGTLLNDGGIAVWITLTGATCVTASSIWAEQVTAQVRRK